MIIALKALGFLLVFFIAIHWLTAGVDNIIEGPPETPDVTLYQPSQTP